MKRATVKPGSRPGPRLGRNTDTIDEFILLHIARRKALAINDNILELDAVYRMIRIKSLQFNESI